MKKERKEILAFLAHRYYLNFFSLLLSVLQLCQVREKGCSLKSAVILALSGFYGKDY